MTRKKFHSLFKVLNKTFFHKSFHFSKRFVFIFENGNRFSTNAVYGAERSKADENQFFILVLPFSTIMCVIYKGVCSRCLVDCWEISRHKWVLQILFCKEGEEEVFADDKSRFWHRQACDVLKDLESARVEKFERILRLSLGKKIRVL